MTRHRRFRRDPGTTEGRASIALLALGSVIVAAMSWQAYDGARSRDAAVERLAADYSAVAAWSFQRFTSASLQSGLEHLLHPVHPNEDGATGPRGAAGLLAAHQRGLHGACVFGGVEQAKSALHFRLGPAIGDVEVAGVLPEGLSESVVVASISELVRDDFPREWMSALAIVDADGRPLPVGFYARRVGPDTLVWAVPFALEGLAMLLRQAANGNDLLPPSLTGPMASEEFLALAAWTPDGQSLWQSRPDVPALDAGPRLTVGPRWGDWTVTAVALPEAAPRLAIGGLPGSRLPVTLALLALTVGLLAVAIRQLRHVHDLARLRADFVSSVSHELRTPLALQRVSIDMLRLGRARDAVVRERALANVDREASRLAHLVDNLLRFSRSGTGNGALRFAPADLGMLVEDTVGGFRELIDPEDGQVRVFVDTDVRAQVDAEAIRRVLLNLLENATKYGRTGQTIDVALIRETGAALLTVEDEGPGVPTSERELIWEPFRRGTRAVGGAAGGSGIGLSVVREIVHAHGGSARVAASAGGGARFEVRLPTVDTPSWSPGLDTGRAAGTCDSLARESAPASCTGAGDTSPEPFSAGPDVAHA